MNNMKVGKIYVAQQQKLGEDWELLTTLDDNGHHSIGVFVSNRPSQVQPGGCFRLTHIEYVGFGSRPDGNGGWYSSVRITGSVEKVSVEEYEAQKQAEQEKIQKSGEKIASASSKAYQSRRSASRPLQPSFA